MSIRKIVCFIMATVMPAACLASGGCALVPQLHNARKIVEGFLQV